MIDGVLLVDKPAGLTSHDVVGKLRRRLSTREIGHAGTLDPMATGVLVVLVGAATRLAPYLTAEDKRYATRVCLGVGTTSHDADGEVIARAAVPDDLPIEAALRLERERREQVPPQISAVHVDGKRAYDQARRGIEVTIAPRPVEVRELALIARGKDERGDFLDLELSVTKGYYVRSLARDLGATLGVPAHLGALRRLRSGAFSVEECVTLDAPDLRERRLSIVDAASRSMPLATLTDVGVARARRGQRLDATGFVTAPRDDEVALWVHGGEPVAIGSGLTVRRGFPWSASPNGNG